MPQACAFAALSSLTTLAWPQSALLPSTPQPLIEEQRLREREQALREQNERSVDGRAQDVFYFSWAMLNAEAEARYLRQHPASMTESDWASGERMWVLDWVAPFGHTAVMRPLVLRLFANRCFRSLYHRGNDKGLRVMQFKGLAVLPLEAQVWFAANPVAS